MTSLVDATSAVHIEREALLEAVLDIFTEDINTYLRLVARWLDADEHKNDPSPTFRGTSDAVKRAWDTRGDLDRYARAHPLTPRLVTALGLEVQ